MKNKKWTKNLALLLFGIFWILIGFQTLHEPIYYFRGALVDFTGKNIFIGISLIVFGVMFCGTYIYNNVKK